MKKAVCSNDLEQTGWDKLATTVFTLIGKSYPLYCRNLWANSGNA